MARPRKTNLKQIDPENEILQAEGGHRNVTLAEQHQYMCAKALMDGPLALHDILTSKDSSPHEKIAAFKALDERAFGQAEQNVNVSGNLQVGYVDLLSQVQQRLDGGQVEAIEDADHEAVEDQSEDYAEKAKSKARDLADLINAKKAKKQSDSEDDSE